MRSFDINKIELVEDDSKKPSLERRLTDEVITSLDPKSEVPPNSEVEGGEYIRFPDGVIQMAAGNSHKKGGIKMNIPDGTRVLSNKLTLSKKQATRLNEEFDLKLSAKDTYATAQKKYDKAVGLSKLYDEQEELFKELGRQQKKDLSDGTERVNNDYLSTKISEIEKQKKEKEGVRDEFFNKVFSMQEGTKKKDNKENSFAHGGISMQNFKAVCEKHGINPEEGMKMLGIELPKYQEGGEVDKWKEQLKKLDPEGKYSTIEQARADLEAGNLSNESYDQIENLLWNIQQFSRESSQESGVVGVDYDRPAGAGVRTTYPYEESEAYTPKGVERLNQFLSKYGLDQIDSNSSKDEIKKAAGRLQNFMGENYPELVYDYMTTKSHKPNKKLESHLQDLGYEPSNEGMQKAIEEGKLSKEGVVKDYQDDLWWYRALDTETKQVPKSEYDKLLQREGAIKQGEDLYFAEDPNNPELYTKYEPFEGEPSETKEEDIAVSTPIRDDINASLQGRLPEWYLLPDQRPLPPSPMEAHMMAQSRLGRIDPVRVGIEPQIQQSAERLKFVSEQSKDLPDSQRFAVLANAQASEAKNINQAITQANMWNAQAQQQAKLFNVGQADREQMMRNQNLLDFERRQLTAKANTEEEYRRYFDELKRQRANDFYTRQNLALINELTPDYSLSPFGMSTQYTPEGEWTPQRSNYRNLVTRGQINRVY